MGQTGGVIPAAFRTRYHDGVESLAALTTGFGETDWGTIACGKWTARDLAGHVVGVIGWYHDWLDRALDGDASPPFEPDDMDAENDRALARIDIDDGPARIELFVEKARRYAARVDDVDWDLPYGYPRGTVTVGQHFGGAATVEWHVHAWDFSNGAHRPADATELFIAAADLHLAGSDSILGRVQRRLAPVAAKRDPWKQMLRAIGRTP